MLGQFYSDSEKKFNVVILAGGLGSRMGVASDHIPKALSKIGHDRAIDIILNKFLLVAKKYIIGTGWHSDLLESYIRGRYQSLNISFSTESVSDLKGNAISLLYALDSVDSRFPTIITFCDLLVLSNPQISSDSLYLANAETKGVVGTFRHSISIKENFAEKVMQFKSPKSVTSIKNGVVGLFVFMDTILLKEIAYSLARKNKLNDITADIVSRYIEERKTSINYVNALLEFGNEDDLERVRKIWETY